MLYLEHRPQLHPDSFRQVRWPAFIESGLGLIKDVFRWVAARVRQKEMGSDGENATRRRYENIGPTAALIAYYRAFSDIPYAKEFAELISAKEIAEQLIVGDEVHLAKVLVAFEARFKSVDAVLERYSRINRIIEIPSGFSTRGLTMATAKPKIEYVECDLPPILNEKEKLIRGLFAAGKNKESPNLRFCSTSILDFEGLRCASATLSKGPIAIITEGLFSYLTAEEKIIAAKNVRKILEQRGGVWIVTDLTRVFTPDDSNAAELRERISKVTGFSPITGCFASISQASRFFKRLGFIVRDYRRSEVMPFLFTPKRTQLTVSEIENLLKRQATFALEV